MEGKQAISKTELIFISGAALTVRPVRLEPHQYFWFTNRGQFLTSPKNAIKINPKKCTPLEPHQYLRPCAATVLYISLSPTLSHAVSTIFLEVFFGVFWKQITPNNSQGTSQLDSSRRRKISLYFLPDLCLSWRLWFLGYHNLWPNWRNNWGLCQVDGLLVRTGDLILVRSSHIHREVKWKDNSRRNENNDNHSCKQTKGDKKHQRRTSTLKHF